MESRSKEQDQLAQEAMLTKDFLYSVLNTTSDICLFHITSDLKMT